MKPWQKSAQSWCLFSLSLIAHFFKLTHTIRGDVLLCPKKILTCFFIEKPCFLCLFLQWQCGVGITLTKVSPNAMLVFTWSNLLSFWFKWKMQCDKLFCHHKLLTWCFIEKSCFVVVALTETLWFWQHLDRNQHHVCVFKSLSLLHVTWMHTKKGIWHVSEFSQIIRVLFC